MALDEKIGLFLANHVDVVRAIVAGIEPDQAARALGGITLGAMIACASRRHGTRKGGVPF
jgi:hypothetical protein